MNAHSSFSYIQVAYNLLNCSSIALPESSGPPLSSCVSVSSNWLHRSLLEQLYLDCKEYCSCMVRPGPSWGAYYQQANYQTRMALLVNLIQPFLPASRRVGRVRIVSLKLSVEQSWLFLFTFPQTVFLLNLPFSGICVQMIIVHHQLLLQVGRNGELFQVPLEWSSNWHCAPFERGQYFLTIRSGCPVSWKE